MFADFRAPSPMNHPNPQTHNPRYHTWQMIHERNRGNGKISFWSDGEYYLGYMYFLYEYASAIAL